MNVDEGNQRRKVSGLLFNLSMTCGHLSLQPDFVLASTETTSIFPSFPPHYPLMNLRVYYSLVIFFVRSVIFFHQFLQHKALLVRLFRILQDALAYSWLPFLIAKHLASNSFLHLLSY